MKKKPWRTIWTALILVIALLFVYYYPLQCIFCRVSYNQYIKQQGIDKQDIEWTRADKIPKVDGWDLTAKYKSDPENVYMYYYHLRGTKGTKMSLGYMSCLVLNKNGEDANQFKYSPLVN